MQRKIFGFFILIMALVLMSCPNPNSNAEDKTVTLLAIPGVSAPEMGSIPVTTVTETAQYRGTVTWSGTPIAFAVSTEYTATIVLKAKEGWTLKGVEVNSFVVAGATATNAVNSGTVVAVFPATTKHAIPISISPVTGTIPVITAIDTAQYTGSISWTPAHTTFAGSTVYTASIVLTAKAGFSLNGVAANSFTVPGAIATNVANSGTVVAVFPATGVADYNSANIGSLKLVPAGRFQRDTIATNISIITKPYRMSAHEITRAQYTAVTSAADPSYTSYSSGIGDPVQNVTWYDAVDFCNKLSVLESLTEVYTIKYRNPATGYPIISAIVTVSNWNTNGYRLPTEMEWMWAAMGATAGTTGYNKPFAGSTGTNAVGDYAWYYLNSAKTQPVGGKTANELSLYDMSGNVREWNWDWYGFNYPTGSQVDYRGPASGSTRIQRGGSFGNNSDYLAIAYRCNYDALCHDWNVGFRVVRP